MVSGAASDVDEFGHRETHEMIPKDIYMYWHDTSTFGLIPLECIRHNLKYNHIYRYWLIVGIENENPYWSQLCALRQTNFNILARSEVTDVSLPEKCNYAHNTEAVLLDVLLNWGGLRCDTDLAFIDDMPEFEASVSIGDFDVLYGCEAGNPHLEQLYTKCLETHKLQWEVQALIPRDDNFFARYRSKEYTLLEMRPHPEQEPSSGDVIGVHFGQTAMAIPTFQQIMANLG